MRKPSERDPGSSVLCFHLQKKKKKRWGQRKTWSLVSTRMAQLCLPAQAAPVMSVPSVGFRTVSQICIRKPAVMGPVGTATHLTPN